MKKRMLFLGLMLGAAIMTTATAYAEEPAAVGAYEAYEEEGMPEDAQEAFDKAMENFEGGEDYTAVKLVESQVVAGMNYRILCDKKGEEGKPDTKLMLTIYKDLDGNSEVTMEQKVVAPENMIIDEECKDFTGKAGFEASDFNWEDKTLTFDLYEDALYDMVDMAKMETGTVIEVDGCYVTVETMEEGEGIRNLEDGGQEKVATLTINKDTAEEYHFVANEGGTWISVLSDDHIDIVNVGEETCALSENLKFTDMTDEPGASVDVPYDELQSYMEEMGDSYMGSYGPYNTKIEVENGEIVSIVRTWMP